MLIAPGPQKRYVYKYDGEIDLMISFNPSEAAVAITNGLLQPTARAFGFAGGTIGNTLLKFRSGSEETGEIVAELLAALMK